MALYKASCVPWGSSSSLTIGLAKRSFSFVGYLRKTSKTFDQPPFQKYILRGHRSPDSTLRLLFLMSSTFRMSILLKGNRTLTVKTASFIIFKKNLTDEFTLKKNHEDKGFKVIDH